MKKLIVFTVILLITVMHSVTAIDLIVLRNGEIIEANVLEISPVEIRYRRMDHLDGPVIVIFVSDVLSIRFENGTVQTFGGAVPAQTVLTQPARTHETAIDPERSIFGISANVGGFLAGSIGGGGGGRMELGRGNFNFELNLGGNSFGFVGLMTLNHFWHSRRGGFYLGGGLGLTSLYAQEYWGWGWYESATTLAFQLGLNIGYKFVTQSGIFFRTGAFVGYAFGDWGMFVFNPDISIGWTMR